MQSQGKTDNADPGSVRRRKWKDILAIAPGIVGVVGPYARSSDGPRCRDPGASAASCAARKPPAAEVDPASWIAITTRSRRILRTRGSVELHS